MKTQKSLNGRTASGYKLIIGETFYTKPSTGNTYFRDAPAVIRFDAYATDVNEHKFNIIPQWASDDDSVALFGTSNAVKFKRVVDTISISGEGLPTEKAVAEYAKVDLLFSGATLELDLSATVGQYRAIIVAETYTTSAPGAVSAIIVVSPSKSGAAVGKATYKNGINHFLLNNGVLTSYFEKADGSSGDRNNYIRYVYGIK